MVNLEVARVRRMLFASSALSIVAAVLGAVVLCRAAWLHGAEGLRGAGGTYGHALATAGTCFLALCKGALEGAAGWRLRAAGATVPAPETVAPLARSWSWVPLVLGFVAMANLVVLAVGAVVVLAAIVAGVLVTAVTLGLAAGEAFRPVDEAIRFFGRPLAYEERALLFVWERVYLAVPAALLVAAWLLFPLFTAAAVHAREGARPGA